MRSILMLLSLFVLLAGWAPAGENNDYFDDAAATTLAGPDLVIAGDVATPGPVDVSRLPVRSVTVREAVLKDGQPVAVPVTIGATDGIKTEIASGDIHPGMPVITDTMGMGR
jgi:hypothetical protein